MIYEERKAIDMFNDRIKFKTKEKTSQLEEKGSLEQIKDHN